VFGHSTRANKKSSKTAEGASGSVVWATALEACVAVPRRVSPVTRGSRSAALLPRHSKT
jgi:hypothetical protein